jgi:hypothetical protein
MSEVERQVGALGGEVTNVKQHVQTSMDGDLALLKEEAKKLRGQGDGWGESLRSRSGD